MVTDVGFGFRESPQSAQKTVAEAKAMAGRQQVTIKGCKCIESI